MRTTRTHVILACVFWLIGFRAVTAGQARAVTQPPSENQRQGRFQLVAVESQLFLLDSTEGRVWRYTKLTIPVSPPSDIDVQNYLDSLIAADEKSIGRRYTDQERLSRKTALRELRKKEIDAMGTPTLDNPCKGLDTCFLEVDRLTLTSGGFQSDAIRK